MWYKVPEIELPPRYSVLDYLRLLETVWSDELNTEKKDSISESRFLKFLRENRIC